YGVLSTSTITGQGMEELRERMRNRICLFSGNSGVGKSALIRHLQPELDIRVGEISETHLKGKHTTTYARMYPLSFGGYIVDTPGIKEFGMVRFTTDELSRYFPEMQQVMGDCRFNNCTHEHEPGCAVKQAVQEGVISKLRYDSYLHILHGDEVPEPGLLVNKNDKK
ncbi:ribosome small subunit-dependent GTPase A, partial [bacterium]|nr:ribosome small subunit-dependent GTPase A [bacterium]